MRAGRGEAATAISVQSRFTGTGGDNAAAALKIRYEWFVDASGRRRRRERVRTHAWPAAIFTPELAELYFAVLDSRHEPGPAGRRLNSSHYETCAGAPLLSTAKEPGRRLSRKQASQRVARALHWVCREVLGRPLPPWDVFCRTRGRDYYGLFGPHVLRALQATYWIGVRERDVIGAGLSAAERRRLRAVPRPGFDALGADTVAYAMHLLNDSKTTLERDYVHLSPGAAAQRRTTPDTLPRERRWEHERAYDEWMDGVVLGDPIKWHRQIGLPLPPGVRLRDLAPDGG